MGSLWYEDVTRSHHNDSLLQATIDNQSVTKAWQQYVSLKSRHEKLQAATDDLSLAVISTARPPRVPNIRPGFHPNLLPDKPKFCFPICEPTSLLSGPNSPGGQARTKASQENFRLPAAPSLTLRGPSKRDLLVLHFKTQCALHHPRFRGVGRRATKNNNRVWQ